MLQAGAESNHWRKPVARAFWPPSRYRPHQRSELHLSSKVLSLRPLTRSVSPQSLSSTTGSRQWLDSTIQFDATLYLSRLYLIEFRERQSSNDKSYPLAGPIFSRPTINLFAIDK
jgi:hypothetical protein